MTKLKKILAAILALSLLAGFSASVASFAIGLVDNLEGQKLTFSVVESGDIEMMIKDDIIGVCLIGKIIGDFTFKISQIKKPEETEMEPEFWNELKTFLAEKYFISEIKVPNQDSVEF